MDLFDANRKQRGYSPLADRMRPRTIDDVVGQEHLLGKGKILRTLIEQDSLTSLIFWGPPGVGKTTIASAIANATGANFVAMSAVNAGAKDVRELASKADDALKFHGKRTILFLDEIHRFNKAQQDVLLPHVERGTIILIGATTENPSFEVNSALLSRSRVFVLNAHTVESLSVIIDRALTDKEYGLGGDSLAIADDAKKYLLEFSNGDARTALNALEMGASFTKAQGKKKISLDFLEEALQHKALQYDKGGEEHYNVISAFIKSMRNSDPNATLYWLARMVDAGENPLFIARRMVVFASEDVGLADPMALVLANAVFQAVDVIGMPEARINLAQGAVYLAEAPKNNRSYMGLETAMGDVKQYGNLPVPLHLRNAVTKLMKDLGYHKGYKYAHDYEDYKTDMQCMPDELKDRKYVE